MGRRLLYPEKMEGTFREGTFAEIDDVLTDGEARTDLVRMAVEREIRSRQRRAARQRNPLSDAEQGGGKIAAEHRTRGLT